MGVLRRFRARQIVDRPRPMPKPPAVLLRPRPAAPLRPAPAREAARRRARPLEPGRSAERGSAVEAARGRRRRQAQEGRLGRRRPQGRRSHARRRARATRRRPSEPPPRRAGSPGSRRCGSTRASVRGEADEAVGRGRSGRRPRRPLRRGRPRRPTRRCAGRSAASTAERLDARLKDASKAFRRERFEEARKLLRPLAEQAPTAESVRELLGLTYYRLGRWKLGRHRARGLPRPQRRHRAAPGARRLLPGARAPRQGRRAVGGAAGRVAQRRARRRGPHRRTPARSPTRAASTTPSGARGVEAARQAAPAAPPPRHLRAGRPVRAGRRRAARPASSSAIVARAPIPELGDVDRPPSAAPAIARRVRRSRTVTPLAVGSGVLPPPRPLTAPSEAPMSTTTVPVRRDQPRHPRRHAQPRRRSCAPLPSGDEVLALELTVRPAEGPAESVPVAWLAAPPAAAAWAAGEEVLVIGRVRRRFFRAGGRTQSRTEVVADRGRAHPAGGGGRQGAGRPRCGARRTVVTAPRGSAMMEATAATKGIERHHEPGAAGEGPGRQGLHRRPRPERGQHPEGPASSTASARTPTRTTPRCSTASTRCAPGSSPARASPATGCSAPSSSRRRWTGRSRAGTRPTYLWEVKGVVPVPEGRQGPRRRGRRRAGDEADARPRRAARAGGRQGRVRHEDALGHQAGRPDGRRRRGRPAVRGRPADPRPPAWCRSSSPRSTSTARRRPRPRRSSRRPSSRSLDALPDDEQVMLKLTLPEEDGFYADLVAHPKVLRGRRALRRLHPRRRQRPPGPQPGRDRQLLPGAHRGALARSSPTRSSTPRSTPVDQGHLRGVDHLAAGSERVGRR